MSNIRKKIKIGIIGVGMVGTPLARFLQEKLRYKRGQDLFLFDKDPRKNYGDDINKAEAIFIAVPSPRQSDGSADLSIIESALSSIKDRKIVVIKSTVPPGTTSYFQKKYPCHKILFNPEFLTEKNAWEDFVHPVRQIVGFADKRNLFAAKTMLSILPKAEFSSPSSKIRITATEAELIKYAGNVYLARRVNLANLLAIFSEKLGADYNKVRLGLAADARIGGSHLDAAHGGYMGFGGYCLPKDLDAFIASIAKSGLHDCADLLRQDGEFNKKVLVNQGLTLEDVSVHDHIWIKERLGDFKRKRVNAQKQKSG